MTEDEIRRRKIPDDEWSVMTQEEKLHAMVMGRVPPKSGIPHLDNFNNANTATSMGEPTDKPAEQSDPTKTKSKYAEHLEHVTKGVSLWLVLGAFGLINLGGVAAYFVKVLKLEAVPVGTILAWDGRSGNPPEGWEICDGSDTTNKVPNLKDRFLKGVTSKDMLNGTHDNKMTCQYLMVSEVPGGPNIIGVIHGANSGEPIEPNSFTVIYIMKVK